MTACKDSQATSGKKAVSATLAGVLAVGLVPAVALADEAVEVTEEDGITERLVTVPGAFAKGTLADAFIWDATANAGAGGYKAADIKKNKVTDILTATGKAIQVVPASVSPYGDADDVTVSDVVANKSSYKMESGYSLQYFSVDQYGNITSGAMSQVVNPGDYCVKVVASSPSAYAGESTQPLYFTIALASLGTPAAYEVNPADRFDYSDTAFTYTGKALDIKFTGFATGVKDSDYDVKFVAADSSPAGAGVPVLNAGKYDAIITGKGIYAGQSCTVQDITVKPFDLSAADIVVNDITGTQAPTHPVSVTLADGSGPAVSLDPSLVDLVFVAGANGDTSISANQAYTFTAQAANQPNTNTNITKTKPVTINKVKALATFTYGDKSTPLPATVTSDLGANAPFDTSKIQVWNGADQQSFANKAYTVTVIDMKTGKAPDPAFAGTTIDKAGTYKVVVTVDPSKTTPTYAVGGSFTTMVTVTDGTINADADAAVSYNFGEPGGTADWQVITSLETTYDFANPVDLANFKVTVTNDKGVELTKGKDFEVVITDAEGRKVTGSLDKAGSYTLTVKGLTYNITGTNTLPITIKALDLRASNLRALSATDQTKALVSKVGGHEYIDTTTAVTLADYPIFYNTGELDDEGEPIYKLVSPGTANAIAGDVDVKWQKLNKDGEWVAAAAATVKGEVATYRVVITPKVETEAGNYVFDADNQTVLTYSAAPKAMFMFDDVAPSAWYFKPVYEAAQPKGDKTATPPVEGPDTAPYMNGYAGANLFGPNDAITRGQVACVLYNMAGGDALGFIPSYTENYGVDTGFSDVDGKMYYAKAIAWAKSTGVVNGFAGTDQFGPDDNITREQFAAMLANYAQKRGATLPSDIDGILAGISDGPSTSDWAKASVAWAVENEVMGRGGFVNPFGTASRAEVAAMAVNYQPRA